MNNAGSQYPIVAEGLEQTLQSEKFRSAAKKAIEKHLDNGEVIGFSEFIIAYSGFHQLTFDKWRYCYGENDGTTTDLDETEQELLLNIIHRILASFLEIAHEIRESLFNASLVDMEIDSECVSSLVLTENKGGSIHVIKGTSSMVKTVVDVDTLKDIKE